MLPLRMLTLPVLALLLATAPAHARTDRRPLPASPQSPAPQGTTGLPGEDFASALPVPALPFSVTGTTCGFANDAFPENPCGAMPGADVVYRYDATADVHVIASTCDSPDPGQVNMLVIHDATVPGTPICDLTVCGNNSRSYLLLRAGHTYYFVIDGEAGYCSDYTLTIVPQTLPGPGESFADAVVIPALPFAASGNTCAMGADVLVECVGAGSPDAVYAFSPSAPTCLNLQLCGSGYDTALAIYSGSPENLVACNDDGCTEGSELSSLLEGVSLLPGQTYYIVVSGFVGECGDYDLHASICAPTAVNARTWGQLKHFYR